MAKGVRQKKFQERNQNRQRFFFLIRQQGRYRLFLVSLSPNFFFKRANEKLGKLDQLFSALFIISRFVNIFFRQSQLNDDIKTNRGPC